MLNIPAKSNVLRMQRQQWIFLEVLVSVLGHRLQKRGPLRHASAAEGIRHHHPAATAQFSKGAAKAAKEGAHEACTGQTW